MRIWMFRSTRSFHYFSIILNDCIQIVFILTTEFAGAP